MVSGFDRGDPLSLRAPGPRGAGPPEGEAALWVLPEEVLWREEPAEAHGAAAQHEGAGRTAELPAAQVEPCGLVY